VRSLNVNTVPTAYTLWNAVVPAISDEAKLENKDLLKAWKYACAARYMQLRGIRPRGERWSQRHMLHQCADINNLAKIVIEVKRRGLLDIYSVDIDMSVVH